MDKRTAICEFLRKHHTGKDKAIYSRELERLSLWMGAPFGGRSAASAKMGFPFAATRPATTMRRPKRRSTTPFAA